MIVSKKGSIECVKILVPYEIGSVNDSGNSSLIHAIEGNNIECVTMLLKEVLIKNYINQTAR